MLRRRFHGLILSVLSVAKLFFLEPRPCCPRRVSAGAAGQRYSDQIAVIGATRGVAVATEDADKSSATDNTD
jgi:hypothetical protein